MDFCDKMANGGAFWEKTFKQNKERKANRGYEGEKEKDPTNEGTLAHNYETRCN